jgi:hypothetical protein
MTSYLFPELVASFAYGQLTKPQVRKLRESEQATLNKAEKETFRFKEFDIQLYTWPGGDKEILLIHGWEGQAGNYSDLVEALLTRGYTVYAFDGPSHGYSSQGETSLFEFTELVGLLIRKFAVSQLVSHSFGSVATTYALFSNPDLIVDKYVLFTTPDKFLERVEEVSRRVGISENAKARLLQRLEKEIDLDLTTLNVSEFVKSVNVSQALILHDKDDRVIPIAQSRNVHKSWGVSQFKEVERTGHFRILRTQEVIDTAVEFLNGDESPSG